MQPAHYKPAVLRSVGQSPVDLDHVGLSLDAGGQPREDRFCLSLSEAERLALALLDAVAVQRYRAVRATCQSPISSGNPSRDGSPQEGQ